MKNLLTLACLFLAIISYGQWHPAGGPYNVGILDLELVNGQVLAGTRGGLYISNDNGQTWFRNEAVPAEAVTQIFAKDGEILLSVVDKNPDLFFVNFRYYIYRSLDNGVTWSVFEETIDLEGNYTNALFKINNSIFFGDEPIFRYDTFGEAWTIPLTTGLGSNSSHHYRQDGENILATSFRGILRISDDLGDSWTRLDSLGGQNTRPAFINDDQILYFGIDSIFISENLGQSWNMAQFPDEDFSLNKLIWGEGGRIYALDRYVSQTAYYSDDGGYNWTALYEPSLNEFLYDLIELPNGDLLLGGSENLYRKRANEDTWQSNNAGMNSASIERMHAFSDGELLAITRNQIFRSTNNGQSWLEDYQLNNLISVNGRAHWASNETYSYLLTEDQLYRSTDNFISYDLIPVEITNLPTNLFRTPPIDVAGENIVIGTNPLIFSSDNGDSWSRDSILTNGNLSVGFRFRIDPENGKIYGYLGDEFYSRFTNGSSWAGPREVGPFFIHDISLHVLGDTILVTTNDEEQWAYINSGGQLETFETTGLPWEDESETGISMPYQVLKIGQSLYGLFRGHGVLQSIDFGKTWTEFNEGLLNLNSKHLTLSDEGLFLATYGTGVWRFGTGFTTRSGMVYFDENNNGIKEPTESPISDVTINTQPFNSYSRSGPNGLFTIHTEISNDTIRAIPPSTHSQVNPPYYLANQQTEDLDFGIYFTENIEDLTITATNTSIFRPGFDNRITLTIKNNGTVELAPTVKLALPSQLDFLEADTNPTLIDGDTLEWQLPVLAAFQTTNIQVDLNVHFTTNINETIRIQSTVYPIDDFSTNNQSNITEGVFGSYDPNDKQVRPENYFTPDDLDDELPLTYTVRFQNTGNYFAQHVRIIDTISNRLDISTLRVLSASHTYEYSFRENRVVEFSFLDILLPDSLNNEPESHGFIKFSIQPSRDLTLGETLENFADIYFDFNLPIRTNTASLEHNFPVFTNFLTVEHLAINISPNPNNGFFRIELDDSANGKGLTKIFDSSGKVVYKKVLEFDTQFKEIQCSDLPSGTYVVTINFDDKVYQGKVIIQ